MPEETKFNTLKRKTSYLKPGLWERFVKVVSLTTKGNVRISSHKELNRLLEDHCEKKEQEFIENPQSIFAGSK